nr:nuclease-related domain-containing protein [Sporosarcina luteola]
MIALEKRIGKGDVNRQRIEERLYNLQAGFSGETQYDKYLAEFKPPYPHAILHDVTLCDDDVFFQMDSILITPAFILISEVKNIAEKIIVKSNPLQFIKEYSNGRRLPLKNPIVELDRKIFHLESWLKKRNIDIPIKGIVAFAYNNELLIEETPSMDIMFTYEISAHLRTLPVTREILNKPEIHRLAKKIKSSHQEFNPFPMIKKYNIHPAHIKPGVICPVCNKLHMMWEQKRWNCSHCGHNGKNDHEHALQDWSMLIKNNITNKEFCYFTKLESRHVAKKMLARSPIELNGFGAGAKYEILLPSSIHVKSKQ